jgi:hypothetical protein
MRGDAANWLDHCDFSFYFWLNGRKQNKRSGLFLWSRLLGAHIANSLSGVDTAVVFQLYRGTTPPGLAGHTNNAPRFLFSGRGSTLVGGSACALTFTMLVVWYGLGESDERRFRLEALLTLTLFSLFNLLVPPHFCCLPGLDSAFLRFLQEKWKISGKIYFLDNSLAFSLQQLAKLPAYRNWSSKEASWVITILPLAALITLDGRVGGR